MPVSSGGGKGIGTTAGKGKGHSDPTSQQSEQKTSSSGSDGEESENSEENLARQ
jgi:hypothetical protein